MDHVQYSGGSAAVLKRECGGREVALVKTLRQQCRLSSQEMRKVKHHRRVSLPVRVGELSMRFVKVLQGGHCLEISPTSERSAADRCEHD